MNYFLSAFVMLTCLSFAYGEIGIASYPLDGIPRETVITDKHIENSPAWKTKAENPPVSARRAYRLAEQYVDANFQEDKDWIRKLAAIVLTPEEEKWFWQVKYEWYHKNGETEEPPDLTVVILMDGTVIQHTTE